MGFSRIVISSGHSTKCPGASAILDEVTEATKVVDRLAFELELRGVEVDTFHDLKSTSVSENLDRICDYHNSKTRELDISVHLNANKPTANPVGTEVLYLTQEALAFELSAAIASCGFKDRGGKYRNDLSFLKNTEMPSVLLEIMFLDSEADVKIYQQNFDQICIALADELAGKAIAYPPAGRPPAVEAAFHAKGTCSYFGGPLDMGVSPSEGLAFIFDVMDAPHLFLPYKPSGTTGLARRLNTAVHYVACRWDYSVTPKSMMLKEVAFVRVPKLGVGLKAYPADWGPNENTGRVADLSPSLMDDLKLQTDRDEVEVIFPYKDD